MALRRLTPRHKSAILLVILLTLATGLMFGLAKCSHPSAEGELLRASTLKSGGDTLDVAIEISPLSYSIADDTITGLDYELLLAMSRLNNRAVKFHPFVSFHEAMDGLTDGLFDMLIYSLPSTDTIHADFRMTDRVFLIREILVQASDKTGLITSPEELAGDTVWITAGSPLKHSIESISDETGEPIHVIEIPDMSAEQLVSLVARGRLPRAVVNEHIATIMRDNYYRNLYPDAPVSFTHNRTWTLAKDNDELCDTINAWLMRFRDTDAYNAIVSRYFRYK